MESITKRIFELQDLEYREFTARLIPNISNERIVGVRSPQFKKLAKEIVKEGKGEVVLASLPHYYFDENNLHAFVIAELKDYDRTVEELDRFLPYVDNWATCDTMKPKAFNKKTCHERLLGDIRRWLNSEHPFTIRFGISMLMTHFLDDNFSTEYLDWVVNVSNDHYYVRMMVAWYFATALAKQYAATLPYIQQRRLAKWNHNKAIQKAIESLRLTTEQKQLLRTLKCP
ncbi:MAG: DNA alkylation repair protein [Prevotella sp.]